MINLSYQTKRCYFYFKWTPNNTIYYRLFFLIVQSDFLLIQIMFKFHYSKCCQMIKSINILIDSVIWEVFFFHIPIKFRKKTSPYKIIWVMIVEKMIAVTLKLFYPIPCLIFLKALILTNWDVSFNCFIIYIMIQFWLFSSFSTALK